MVPALLFWLIAAMAGTDQDVTAAASAQTAPTQPCPSVPLPVEGALAAWNGKPALMTIEHAEKHGGGHHGDAGHHGKGHIGHPIPGIGQPVLVPLHAMPAEHFPVAPERATAPGTNGAHLSFRIEKAGDYAVALSGPAWVDLLDGDKALASTRHGHGPRCTTLRKMVVFALKPGSYGLQISGAKAQNITVMIAPAPAD